ncbi:Mitochondrial import receptor subunit [Colletotrichum higginsianum IMI 349063]|uniref:Mitochondrial import receptor subunit n=3 Tax=Colletotrichum higginsianum TaxID=80884 RepID=A0A1B7YD54_COLHI|nr:Mitochondrial import receptor subunit [Colletotrichum higginsianum IMI 349063]OBR09957.1 Mitochondrial import receptor subunit [Colletotrichum higginsianum IMI 349063]TID07030.1 Metaxin-like protein [Colletotrichum higginsianum]
MDVLELYVWGPAFGLPSVDAECLAAIAYLHTALPSSQWRLVASNDPAVDTSNRLPALKAGGVWVSGYVAIASHLASLSPHSPSWDLDLDSRLTPSQRADALAYGAHIDAHFAPLLDAALYGTHENWTAVTRPALSHVLGFPLSWTVPVMLRNQATARCAHLGLDSLGAEDDSSGGSDAQGSALDRAMKHLPVSSRKTVLEEMKAGTARGIRLHTITVDALMPLEALRARGEDAPGEKKRFFGGEVPTSLDCLVAGYLALVRAVDLPQPWLRTILDSKFSHLAAMADDLRDECLTSPGALPWAVAPSSAFRTAARFLDNVVQATPNLGEAYVHEWRRRAEARAKGVADRRTLALAGGVLAAGTAIAYGVWVYRSLPPWGMRTQTWMAEKRGLNRFGDLGAMLDFSLGLADPAPRASPSAGWGGGFDKEHRVVESELAVD